MKKIKLVALCSQRDVASDKATGDQITDAVLSEYKATVIGFKCTFLFPLNDKAAKRDCKKKLGLRTNNQSQVDYFLYFRQCTSVSQQITM